MHGAYKHLEAKLRVGELTIGQWIGLSVGAVTALMWGLYLSPFGSSLTIFTACYIGGLPTAGIFLATMSEADMLLMARSALSWWRTDGRLPAGPGPATGGYVVREDERAPTAHERETQLEDLDLAALWES